MVANEDDATKQTNQHQPVPPDKPDHTLKQGRKFATNLTKSVNAQVSNILFGDDELSWEELCEIEKRRRAILKNSDMSFFRILLFWDGTVLQTMVKDPLLWITLFIYGAIRVGARLGLPEFVSDLGGADIGVIGAFLSFFLVFFVVTSNGRFTTLYNASMSCEGRIFDVAATVRVALPRERALRLIRYMNAVHVSAYVGLSDVYTFREFFSNLNQRNQFLTKSEVERMVAMNMDKGGSCYRELTVWCCHEIAMAVKAGIIDGRMASGLRAQVLRLRGALGTLYDYDDQPISFFYVHFVCLLSVMYLPLFAVSAGLDAGTGDDAYWLNDAVQGLIVLLQAIFVIGLRILGVKMSDPYGSDLEDLSVMHYINFTWRMSNRMLNSSLPDEISAEEEESLCQTKEAPLGDAWEPSGICEEMNVNHCDNDNLVDEMNERMES